VAASTVLVRVEVFIVLAPAIEVRRDWGVGTVLLKASSKVVDQFIEKYSWAWRKVNSTSLGIRWQRAAHDFALAGIAASQWPVRRAALRVDRGPLRVWGRCATRRGTLAVGAALGLVERAALLVDGAAFRIDRPGSARRSTLAVGAALRPVRRASGRRCNGRARHDLRPRRVRRCQCRS